MVAQGVVPEWPRESQDLVPFTEILNHGEPVETLQYCVVRPLFGERPPAADAVADWSDPEEVEDVKGHLLTGDQPPGLYRVYALVTGNPEKVVMELGDFRLT